MNDKKRPRYPKGQPPAATPSEMLMALKGRLELMTAIVDVVDDKEITDAALVVMANALSERARNQARHTDETYRTVIYAVANLLEEVASQLILTARVQADDLSERDREFARHFCGLQAKMLTALYGCTPATHQLWRVIDYMVVWSRMDLAGLALSIAKRRGPQEEKFKGVFLAEHLYVVTRRQTKCDPEALDKLYKAWCAVPVHGRVRSRLQLPTGSVWEATATFSAGMGWGGGDGDTLKKEYRKYREKNFDYSELSEDEEFLFMGLLDACETFRLLGMETSPEEWVTAWRAHARERKSYRMVKTKNTSG